MSLKLKTILTTTVLLASLATASLPSAPASAASAETVRAGRVAAEANGIVLDSDADAAELAVLNTVNDGVLPQIDFDTDNTVSRIDGLISDKTVRSARDAKAVIASIADLLGIQDADAELSFFKEDEFDGTTAYTFRQVYQGIVLENSYVTLYVNGSTGKADYLNSGFVPDFSIDTVPAITAGQVRTIVRKAYDAGLSEDAALVIFEQQDGTMRLAYEAKTLSDAYPTVYVDAQDGSVLFAPKAETGASASYTYNGTHNPVTGLNYFTVKTESYNYNGTQYYRLHDTTRNIWIVSNPSGFVSFANNSLNYPYYVRTDSNYWNINKYECQTRLEKLYPSDFQNYISRQMYSNNWSGHDVEVGVLYQVAQAHDFYKNVCNRNGTDGQGGRLFVNPFLNEQNAYASPTYNYIQFGQEDNTYYDWAKELGVVAHEMTHRVTNCIVLWAGSGWNQNWQEYDGEVAILNEAYSDIMGEYAAGYWGETMDWKNGNKIRKDGNAMRDATRGEWYYYQGNHFFKADMLTSSNNESHAGATIFSHMAYRMGQYGIPNYIARKIWYKSIGYMNQGRDNTSFVNCRVAVERAAQDIAYEYYPNNAADRKNLQIKVASAFNYGHVFYNNDRLGDINQDGYINSADVNLITIVATNSNYLSSPYQISLGDVNFDGRVTMSDAEKLQRYISYNEPLE